jgi:hypothetical protein
MNAIDCMISADCINNIDAKSNGEMSSTFKTKMNESISDSIKNLAEAIIDLKKWEGLDNRLTDNERNILFPALSGYNSLEDQLKRARTLVSYNVIQLESLFELRDGKPEINTPENREIVENAPKITAVLKK